MKLAINGQELHRRWLIEVIIILKIIFILNYGEQQEKLISLYQEYSINKKNKSNLMMSI